MTKEEKQKVVKYLNNGGAYDDLPLKTQEALRSDPHNLTDIDPKEIEEVLAETEKEVKTMSTELPEAPMSISTTAYYKGFSVMITKRDPEVKVLPLIESHMKMIDFLIEKGFKPSWNTETNNAHANGAGQGKPAFNSRPSQTRESADCSHEHTADKQSSGFKKPENKGRWYISCMDCNKFLGWKETPAAGGDF